MSTVVRSNFVLKLRGILLGDLATSEVATVGVSPSGTLVVDREKLHESPAYKRQITALKQLEEIDSDIAK